MVRIARDQEERDRILKFENNMVVTASAGSGKTTLLVKKMIQDVENIKGYKKIAALSFTNESKNDIQSKFNEFDANYNPRITINTIESFAFSEIIQPFLINCGIEYESELLRVSYSNSHSIQTFEEGIEKIASDNLVPKYNNNYNNFVFELALHVLQNSVNAQEYLKYTYAKFYIDEYQDCDRDQHNLFIYMCENLNINLVIFGDTEQALYAWRGAVPEELNNLTKNELFRPFVLYENFRSLPRLVDFSLTIRDREFVPDEIQNEGDILYLNTSSQKSDVIVNLINNNIINLDHELLILVGVNNDIVKLKNELEIEYPNTFYHRPRTELNDCINTVLMESIAKYFFNANYYIYDFLEENHLIEENKLFKKELKRILDKLIAEDDKILYLNKIYNYLDFDNVTIESLDNRFEIEILEEILINPEMAKVYAIDNTRTHAILTTSSAKGLGYNQVVIFTDYYIRYGKFQKNQNYVGITRAKEKLILIDDFNETYKKAIESIVMGNSDGDYCFTDFVDFIDYEL